MKYPIQENVNHPCYGHPCDDCELCLSGECCGDSVEEADLPEEGSWPDLYGTLGVLLVNDRSELQCHACGQWHAALYVHARSHKLSADEYRSMFGLGCTTPLAGPELRAKRSKALRENVEAGKLVRPTSLPSFTGEQLSQIAWHRVQRAEYRNPFDDPAVQKKAQLNRKNSLSDPERFRSYRRKLIARRAKQASNRDGVECIVCKALFCTLYHTPRKTCGSDECKREVKRRAALARRS